MLDRAEGRWASVGPREDRKPFPGLWLEVDGDVLTHALDANCNTDEGSVICQPDFPDLVPGRVGRIALEGDQLVLFNPGGSEIARFEREQH